MHTICASEKQNMQDNICLIQKEIQILLKKQTGTVFYVLFCKITKKMNTVSVKQQSMPLTL